MSRFRPSRNYVSGKVVFEGGPVEIDGDLVVSGSVTANEYNVNVINTNVTHIDADGDTKFGDSADDTHQFTGSVFINGPLSASSIIGLSSSVPGGLDTYVQFNDGGLFGGDSDFVWDKTSNALTVTGDITASANISGAFFYGDGSNLTNLPGGSPGGTNTQIQFNDDGSFAGDADFTWSTGSNTLTVTGDISGSGNVSGSAFYGDGSNLTNLPSAPISTYTNGIDNYIITAVDASSVQGEVNLQFDGTTLAVTGDISGSGNISGSAFYGDGSNLTNLTIPSGTIGRIDSTGAETFYLTISGAVAASVAGDYVRVGPGTYIEDTPIVIPAGISVTGEAGWQVTDVSSSTGTGDVFQLADGSLLKDFKIAIPADTGSYAVSFSGSAPSQVASANFLSFYGGTGLRGSGYGNIGRGKTIALEIRYSTGDCDAILDVQDGILAVEGVHIPNSAGSVDCAVRAYSPASPRVGNRGRFQGIDINMGATNVEDGFCIGGSAVVVLQGVNLFNIQNTFHLTSNSASLLVTSGLSDPAVNDIKVDAGLTGDAAITRLSAFMNGVFDIPTTWIPSDHAWTFFTEGIGADEASQQLWGANQVIGHPEFGGGFSAGEGTNYATNNTIFTTTNDAAGGDNGSNFIDVSTSGSSTEGSTFSFQSASAGCSILWCTNRKDSSDTTLKHWGLEVDQTTAATTGSGNFILEYQSAADTWTEIGVMAVSSEEQYRYANNIFLRANSEERLFAGITNNDSWEPTLINGVTGRWMRVRIESTVTTAPVFERFRLMPSHTVINAKGQKFAAGLAQWKKRISLNPDLGGGMLTDETYTVGSGGNISFTVKDVVLDAATGNGSVAGSILEIPSGLCTAFPLAIKLIYAFNTTSTATVLNFKHYVAQLQGNLIADPSGAIIPIERTAANTEVWTTNAASVDSQSTPAGVADKFFSLTKTTPADISAAYEGDMIFVEIDITTMNSELTMVALQIEGIAFTEGAVH